MNLIRILAVGLIVWLVYRMLRQWMAGKKQKQTSTRKKSPVMEKMVKCEVCGLHIPENESVQSGDNYFCSTRHRDKFLS